MVRVYLADIGEEHLKSALEKGVLAHALQSQAARRLLLEALEGEYPTLAGSFRIEKDSRGKPYLPGHEKIHISIAHSGRLAACAIADRAVGVDVEFRRERPGCARISRRLHKREQEWLLRQPKEEQEKAFYDLWVRKESFMKAAGEGLRMGLDSFCTVDRLEGEDSLYSGRPLEVSQDYSPAAYYIWQYEAGDGSYSLAACSEDAVFEKEAVFLAISGAGR